MKQISSKLKTHIKNINIINNNIEKLIFKIIFLSLGALALLYVLLLGNMVSNILQRRNLESDIRVLSSEIGNLELIYLSMSNNVDLALSYSLGFKEIKANFATRKFLGYRSTGEFLDNIKTLQNGI